VARQLQPLIVTSLWLFVVTKLTKPAIFSPKILNLMPVFKNKTVASRILSLTGDLMAVVRYAVAVTDPTIEFWRSALIL
jgi:hypothetical protein